MSNLGVKPTWLLKETGNSALEAEPRIPPNPKKYPTKYFSKTSSFLVKYLNTILVHFGYFNNFNIFIYYLIYVFNISQLYLLNMNLSLNLIKYLN